LKVLILIFHESIGVRPLKSPSEAPDSTKPIIDGNVQPDGLEFAVRQVDPITFSDEGMVRNLEFDICEMALNTYLCAEVLRQTHHRNSVFLKRSFTTDPLSAM